MLGQKEQQKRKVFLGSLQDSVPWEIAWLYSRHRKRDFQDSEKHHIIAIRTEILHDSGSVTRQSPL